MPTGRNASAWARRERRAFAHPTCLLRKLAAGLGLLAPELDAFGVVHGALADHLGEHEVGDELDFPVLQRRRGVAHALSRFRQVGLLEAVAAAVAVRELVERRHPGAGQA